MVRSFVMFAVLCIKGGIPSLGWCVFMKLWQIEVEDFSGTRHLP
jgi:hypothetical protein